jgi:hypothetical protein
VWRIRYNDELYKMYKDMALSPYIHLKRLMWAGWGDHEIDGKMSFRGMQPTCYGLGTGRMQQEIRS